MVISPLAVLRDSAIMMVVSFLTGINLGVAYLGTELTDSAVGAYNIIAMTATFAVLGGLTRNNRFYHLFIVAIVVWSVSVVNVWFSDAEPIYWLASIFWALATMCVGGAVSLKLIPPQDTTIASIERRRFFIGFLVIFLSSSVSISLYQGFVLTNHLMFIGFPLPAAVLVLLLAKHRFLTLAVKIWSLILIIGGGAGIVHILLQLVILSLDREAVDMSILIVWNIVIKSCSVIVGALYFRKCDDYLRFLLQKSAIHTASGAT